MTEVWFAAGVRTPFAKVDGALAAHDAIGLSVPVVQHMIGLLAAAPSSPSAPMAARARWCCWKLVKAVQFSAGRGTLAIQFTEAERSTP